MVCVVRYVYDVSVMTAVSVLRVVSCVLYFVFLVLPCVSLSVMYITMCVFFVLLKSGVFCVSSV